MARFALLRPHIEDGVALAGAAREAGVPLRTAQRWLARYREPTRERSASFSNATPRRCGTTATG
jgi:hypothetical protein